MEKAFKSKSETLTPLGVGFYSNMNATVFGDTSESVGEVIESTFSFSVNFSEYNQSQTSIII